MFYIIDTTTGEVLGFLPKNLVNENLYKLHDMGHAYQNLLVQVDAPSGFNLRATEWLGIE